MLPKQKYEKVNISFSDLEKYRDNEGFINLDKLNIKLTEDSKEPRGNQKRIKNWLDFQGTKALVKGEIILDQEPNYGIYAELIVSKIAKYYHLKHASYDLIKINNTKGVICLNILKDKEKMVSLHDLIGDDDNTEYIDVSDYNYTIKKLKSSLKELKFSDDVIKKIIIDYQKYLIFTILCLETDKHPENISFIIKDKEIELCPNYDSEASFLLDTDISTIKNILADFNYLKQVEAISEPRIGIIKTKEDGGFGSIWQDTLEELIVDDEVYNYALETFDNEIDMDLIFLEIEKDLKVYLPEEVKLLSKYAYLIRHNKMMQIIKGTYI